MAEVNANSGSGTDGEPENKNNQSTTQGGNDDWKAKYEQLQKDHDTLQKDFTVLEQNRNLFRKQAEEADTEKTKMATKVESVQSELDTFKNEVSNKEKAQVAKTKAGEILADYDDKVKKLAELTGVELGDAEDEDAIKAYTTKLDAMKETVGTTDSKSPAKPKPPVTSNNDRVESAPTSKQTEADALAALEAKLLDAKF